MTACLICGTTTAMIETKICEMCWSVRKSPLGRFAVRMLGMLKKQRGRGPSDCMGIVEEAQDLACRLGLL